jgi:hypothetical protein
MENIFTGKLDKFNINTNIFETFVFICCFDSETLGYKEHEQNKYFVELFSFSVIESIKEKQFNKVENIKTKVYQFDLKIGKKILALRTADEPEALKWSECFKRIFTLKDALNTPKKLDNKAEDNDEEYELIRFKESGSDKQYQRLKNIASSETDSLNRSLRSNLVFYSEASKKTSKHAPTESNGIRRPKPRFSNNEGHNVPTGLRNNSKHNTSSYNQDKVNLFRQLVFNPKEQVNQSGDDFIMFGGLEKVKTLDLSEYLNDSKHRTEADSAKSSLKDAKEILLGLEKLKQNNNGVFKNENFSLNPGSTSPATNKKYKDLVDNIGLSKQERPKNMKILNMYKFSFGNLEEIHTNNNSNNNSKNNSKNNSPKDNSKNNSIIVANEDNIITFNNNNNCYDTYVANSEEEGCSASDRSFGSLRSNSYERIIARRMTNESNRFNKRQSKTEPGDLNDLSLDIFDEVESDERIIKDINIFDNHKRLEDFLISSEDGNAKKFKRMLKEQEELNLKTDGMKRLQKTSGRKIFKYRTSKTENML